MADFDATKRKIERENRELYAKIAYHYPQYSLQDAENLPYGDQMLLANYADLEHYRNINNMLDVMTGSRSKKAYKSVKSKLKSIIGKLEKRL